uniref:RING-type domain-containing protein n=1 Tax=Caenorhabditis japonica TaxID=281687 RepID=A0A8R1HUM5_CAEJA
MTEGGIGYEEDYEIATGSNLTELAVDPPVEQYTEPIFARYRENDGFWAMDIDVQVALLITLTVAFALITRTINALLRNRQGRQRNVDESAQGLSPEQAEIRRQNAQRRIDEALEQTEHDCPICLAPAQFPVLTDCGHIFCCSCIIGYWQHSKAIVSPCDCAICRSTFHMLLPVRWPTRDGVNVSDETIDGIHENNMRIDDYNRRFSNDRPILDYIRDIPILIPFLIRNFFRNDLFTVVSQIRIAVVFVGLFAYLLIPVDVVPESLYGIMGFFDDCIIGILVVGALIRWLRSYMADRGLARN